MVKLQNLISKNLTLNKQSLHAKRGGKHIGLLGKGSELTEGDRDVALGLLCFSHLGLKTRPRQRNDVAFSRTSKVVAVVWRTEGVDKEETVPSNGEGFAR